MNDDNQPQGNTPNEPKGDTGNSLQNKHDTQHVLSNEEIQRLAQQSAQGRDLGQFHQTQKTSSADSESISSLKDEIEQALGEKGEGPVSQPNTSLNKPASRDESLLELRKEIEASLSNDAPDVQENDTTNLETQEKKDSDTTPGPAGQAALAAMEKRNNSVPDQENIDSNSVNEKQPTSEDGEEQAAIEALRGQISDSLEEVNNERAQADNTGVGQTYYSDLSSAMSSNEPRTMSELIRQSRFEEKERKVLSATSKKNILFIAGGIILLILGIVALAFSFRSEPEVEFITDRTVSSLVQSEYSTGINITGLDTTTINNAIRDVIEKDFQEDTVHQIYYVKNDGAGNLRRLGINDIFDATESKTPNLLYDNIEPEFTHGVYTSDRRYPFLLLKSLSYDRVMLGMKEWEPTMIDDLTVFLDLPPEATDRSLVEDGFEDDLIRNKNVRLARYIPREKDSRNIFDFLNLRPEEPEDQNQVNNRVQNFFEGDEINILYEAENNDGSVGVDGEPDNALPISFGSIKKQFARLFTPHSVTAQSSQTTGVGFNTIGSGQSGTETCYDTTRPGETFRPDEVNEALPNIFCSNVITQGDAISNISTDRTEPICFDNSTGNRVEGSGVATNPSLTCFEQYACYRYVCRQGNQAVSQDLLGTPGVVCSEDRSQRVFADNDDRFNPEVDGGPKICYPYFGISNLQNVSQAAMCFIQEGGDLNYLPGVTAPDPSRNIVCEYPINRSETICLDANQNVVPASDPSRRICFKPLANDTTLTNQGGVDQGIAIGQECSDQALPVQELRIRFAQVAQQLRLIREALQAVGADEAAQKVNDAANTFHQLSISNLGSIELVQEGIQALEVIKGIQNGVLKTGNPVIDIIGNSGLIDINIPQELIDLINLLECALGYQENILWPPLFDMPQGITILPGQQVPELEPIQQVLVAMGLMTPIQANGTHTVTSQQAIIQFQIANGLEPNGIIDPNTLLLLSEIVEHQDGLLSGTSIATIDDYFIVTNGAVSNNGQQILTMGAYNPSVQQLQVTLYALGYSVNQINGLFDENTCDALQEFQTANGYQPSNDTDCIPGAATIEALNNAIREKGLLGGGFRLNEDNILEGTGPLEGTLGPGEIDFGVNTAYADSLKEGDVVLLYTFLDEETLLIARESVVIDEIIERRANEDIFN